jgi:antirestriction protein
MASKEIKIYVANLSEYNNGRNLGEWFELPCSFYDIKKKLRLDEPDYGEEWIILDYEAPFKIGEYDSIEKLNKYAEQLGNMPNEILENLEGITEYERLDELLDNGGKNFTIYNEIED